MAGPDSSVATCLKQESETGDSKKVKKSKSKIRQVANLTSYDAIQKIRHAGEELTTGELSFDYKTALQVLEFLMFTILIFGAKLHES